MSVIAVPSASVTVRRLSSSSTSAEARVAARTASIEKKTASARFMSSPFGGGQLVHEDDPARIPALRGHPAPALELPGDHVAVLELVQGQRDLHRRRLLVVFRTEHDLLPARGPEERILDLDRHRSDPLVLQGG